MSCCLDNTNGVAAGSSSSSFVTIQRVDITVPAVAGVQGAWDFEDTVNDRSGNNLHLNSGVATMGYVTLNGKRCAYRPGNATWARATHDSELLISGALTVHHLVMLTQDVQSSDNYYTFMDSSEAQSDNIQYALANNQGSDGDKFRYESENGLGVNSDANFGLVVGVYSWMLLTLTRNAAGTSVSFYVNGELAGSTPTVSGLTQPDGGTTARLHLYDPASANSAVASYVGDLVIQNVEMAAADILAVARQVGVAPPA